MRDSRGTRSRFRPGMLIPLLLLGLCLPFQTAAAQEVPEATDEQEVTEAEAVLAAALVEAEKSDRLVFLHTGADW